MRRKLVFKKRLFLHRLWVRVSSVRMMMNQKQFVFANRRFLTAVYILFMRCQIYQLVMDCLKLLEHENQNGILKFFRLCFFLFPVWRANQSAVNEKDGDGRGIDKQDEISMKLCDASSNTRKPRRILDGVRLIQSPARANLLLSSSRSFTLILKHEKISNIFQHVFALLYKIIRFQCEHTST